jgi:nucleoside-diphosphate-sugar epimerase
MSVLITGGSGHIGTWTARLLSGRGQEVYLLDLRPPPEDILAPPGEGGVHFLYGDVMDFPCLTRIFHQHGRGLTGVIHTVGIMGEFLTRNPHLHTKINVEGFLNILEVARIFEVPKVVFTSSGAVYGRARGKASEEGHPVSPSDLYGATKAACEFIGIQYAHQFQMDVRVARLYFVYGPGKFPSRFVQLYKAAFGALEGLKGVHLPKGGDQRLDFTYVEDAAEGIVRLLEAEEVRHQIFNIATGQPHRVSEVAQLCRRISRFPSDIRIGPGILMPRCEALDISRAMEELNYHPRFSLEEGVEQYALWLKEQLSVHAKTT